MVKWGLLLGLITLAGLGAFQSAFVVNERNQVAIVRFGRVIDVKTEPGLYFKLPFSFMGADELRTFEDRALRVDLSDIRLQVSGGKFYKVNAFLVYRIEDTERFLKSVSGNIEMGEQRLLTRFNASLRKVYGSHGFEAALSSARGSMMDQVAASLRPYAAGLGLGIVDVRILRTDLTDPVLPKAYDRMQAERIAVAERIRARGREAALRIKASADRRAVEIRAAAQRDGEILMGEGDAASTRIYANAHRRSPEFYAFYRSMEAYRIALNPDTTTMILSLSSPFFSHFRGNTNWRPGKDGVSPNPETSYSSTVEG